MADIRGRKDFKRQIRRALAAALVQLVPVADDRDVRLYHRLYILRPVALPLKEADVEGGGDGKAFVALQIVCQLTHQLCADKLVDGCGRGEHDSLAVNQLIPLRALPQQIVRIGVVLLFRRQCHGVSSF